MEAWVTPPPEGDVPALGEAARRRAEAVRWLLSPADTLPSLPRPVMARWLLDRLARALRRRGWTVDRRYAGTRPVLRVFFPDTPCLGDSVTVVAGDGGWWYRSSTGEMLAPCSDMDLAVSRVTTALERWISAARLSGGTGGL